jgi:N-glycosylase/DNA lyase
MTVNKNNWEKIISKFDSFELELSKDINNNSLNDFFKSIREYFENNSFKKWQIEEAKKRTLKIMTILEELKKDLQLRSSELLSKKSQFDSYLKSSSILEK